MKMQLLVVFTVLFSSSAFAATGTEAWSLGLVGGITTSNQSDLNTLITRANTRVGGISTPQFGNAWEIGGQIGRRFNGSVVGLYIRPTYYWNGVTGNGSGGTYSYSLSGFTVTPLLRVYILEGASTHLYIQGGVGWGSLSTSIQEGGSTVKASGSNFGYQGGMGVQFCFGARSQHCPFAEGNVRYLSIDRNIVSDSSGSFASSGANASVSQINKGLELELDGHDLSTTMSGVQGFVGYQYNL